MYFVFQTFTTVIEHNLSCILHQSELDPFHFFLISCSIVQIILKLLCVKQLVLRPVSIPIS